MMDSTEITDAENDMTDRLRHLSDPEFMTHWAALRNRLFFIPKEASWYPEIKRRYDEAAIEYRRRMDDGFTRPETTS